MVFKAHWVLHLVFSGTTPSDAFSNSCCFVSEPKRLFFKDNEIRLFFLGGTSFSAISAPKTNLAPSTRPRVYYKSFKARFRVLYRIYSTSGCSLESHTALGSASCCMTFSIAPTRAVFPVQHSEPCFNYYILILSLASSKANLFYNFFFSCIQYLSFFPVKYWNDHVYIYAGVPYTIRQAIHRLIDY